MIKSPIEELTSYTKKLKEWRRIWKNFVTEGKLDETSLRPEIARSWHKCRELKIDPYQGKFKRLSAGELSRRCQQEVLLFKLVKPFVDNLFDAIKYLGFLVILYDCEGYALYMAADEKIRKNLHELDFGEGVDMKEEVIGTNCVGLALQYGKPFSVKGYEHYCQLLHKFRGSAAPIYSVEGKILGVISIIGLRGISLPLNIPGMIKTTVNAIEQILRAHHTSQELLVSNKFLEAVLGSISEGLIVFDENGRIEQVNTYAQRLLGSEKIEGKTLPQVLTFKACPTERVIRGEIEPKNREIEVKTTRGVVKCIANVTKIETEVEEPVRRMLVFKEYSEVKKFVGTLVTRRAKYTFGDIIGESKMIKEVKNLAKVASQTPSNVLIYGESGTGKELFAQAIHNESPRRDGPFVALNCAAIPRELIESELFGYEEGAFTGARRGGALGKFELAHRGTIFLDEIGDMPQELQMKLLRVLQDKEMYRVGGITPVILDVRVIAATNQDLLEKIKTGDFREELYYRLNILNITIPPLRDRKDDIEVLIKYFIEKFNEGLGKHVQEISEECLRVFWNYSWPGNVRELENVIEHAMVLTQGETITLEALPERLKGIYYQEMVPQKITQPIFIEERKRQEERVSEIYQRALATAKGNISKAAQLVGVSRATFYRKLKKYNLEKEAKRARGVIV